MDVYNSAQYCTIVFDYREYVSVHGTLNRNHNLRQRSYGARRILRTNNAEFRHKLVLSIFVKILLIHRASITSCEAESQSFFQIRREMNFHCRCIKMKTVLKSAKL